MFHISKMFHLSISMLILLLSVSCNTPGFTLASTNTPTFTPSVTPPPTATSTATPTPTNTPIPVGAIISYLHSERGQDNLHIVDIDYGTQMRLNPTSHDVTFYSWSPDGQQIVYQASNGTDNEVFSIAWNGLSEPKRLLSNSADGFYPVWSPDGNKIAFFSRRLGHWALFTMSTDGTGQKAITANTVFGSAASWSPDSTKIVFNPWHNTMSPPFIACVNADGSGFTELTAGEYNASEPVWSPTSDVILFSSLKSGRPQIYSIKPDGTGLVALTNSAGGNSNPVWSPDGTKIAFVSWRDSTYPNDCEGGDCNYEIYVMNADGSNQTRLTDNPAEDWAPVWSPDGTKIAFQSLRDEPVKPKDCGDICNSEIYIMDIDGNNVIRITKNATPDFAIAWRPTGK